MNLQESPNSVTFASKIKVTEMEELLRQYAPITLDEMTGVKLLNRTDTKFVTNMPTLMRLLEMACGDYYVQDIDGVRIAPYYTVYFDTDDCVMYRRHEAGHMNRQKLRVRSYVDSGLNFLEVKTKNNRGRTKKKRLTLEGFDPEHCSEFRVQSAEYADFLHTWLRYDPALMTEQLENRFDRITLVNKGKTERLTIDTNLRFHNIATDSYRFMDGVRDHRAEARRQRAFTHPPHAPRPAHQAPRLLEILHRLGLHQRCPPLQPHQAPPPQHPENYRTIDIIYKL